MAWPQFDAAEVTFWQRLRDALAGHGLQLVLASTSTPPPSLGVPHIPAVPTIDALFPPPSSEPGFSLDDIGLDPAALLAREAEWGAPSVLPQIETFRRRAMDAIAAHWSRTIALLDPGVVVIWNGHHVSEMILDAVCRTCAVPVLSVERAPIPQALFADERGLSAASDVAQRPSWTVADVRWRERADAVIEWLVAGRQTWWQQPAARDAAPAGLRRELGIPDGSQVILFAAQVDQDTQQFLFSPHFASNLAAFAWLLEQLGEPSGLYVLGKHHPKSRTDPVAYERVLDASGVPGAWRTDLAIDDALAVADRVAAVNSTVLYEALARDLPVLAMGQWLLTGRDAAWEIHDRAQGRASLEAWLAAREQPAKQAAWRDALAFLLSNSLYAFAPDIEAAGVPGAAGLAARIADLSGRRRERAAASPVIDRWLAAGAHNGSWMIPGDVAGLDDGREWQRAHTLRHQLLEARAAVERGRRLVVWGGGAGGRAAGALLATMSVRVAAFVSSSPEQSHVDGREVISPAGLIAGPSRDFVLIASRAAAEIVPALTAKGFAPSQDYDVLDVDLLAEMSAKTLSRPA